MEQQRTQTSTQIRNFYSDQSCLGMKFYNVNLALQFYPFQAKNQNGRNTYDMKNGEITTIDFEGAFALWKACQDIIDEKVQTLNLTIAAGSGANIILERKMNGNVFETYLTIQKNGKMIPFKFNTMQQQVNGQMKQIETGLGAVAATIHGYLNGVNSERHLNKLTEDYAKLQEGKQGNQNNNQYRNNNGYQKNNGYQNKNYNNNYKNNNYQKNYNNPNTQSFSDYKINN